MDERKNKGVKVAARKRMEILPGTIVAHRGKIYRTVRATDVDEILAVDGDGLAHKLPLSEIGFPESGDASLPEAEDLHLIDEEDWETVQCRLDGIRPILDGLGAEEVAKKGEEMGVHYTTLYRWYRRYREGGVQALIPGKRGRREGARLLHPVTEAIIREVIDEFYLSRQKPKAQWTIRKIHRRCLDAGVPLPGKNTIRNRIAMIGPRRASEKREGSDVARDRFDPAPGTFRADYPLQTVQIDHTKMDVVVVDAHTRKPIGRPWLTLAVDVYSRMIHGYYLSLEPPSAASVAMCISCAVLPKERLLLEHDVDGDWKIQGIMDTVHVDNGADFRSKALERACAAHGIHIDFRPLGKTAYGGHIERLIGTVMSVSHLVPGTTFSSVKDKGKYDSDAEAVMTMEELERWLLTFIVKVYHRRPHAALGESPEERYRRGVLSEDGAGIPAVPADRHGFYLDFLPAFERTIQRNGVGIEGVRYYDPVLRPFVLAEDRDTGKRKRFLFRRDPKNVSEVWFYHEEERRYYRIPEASQTMPDMTLWEFRASKGKAAEKTRGRAVEPPEVLKAYDELFEQAEKAGRETKKARRGKERKRRAASDYGRAVPPKEKTGRKAPAPERDDSLWDDIPDFDII